eukprot:scaffold3096_cov115-Isochrysis_galbana.AAC.3
MAALRELAAVAREPDAGSAAARQPMLRLRVRLRAAADELVCRAGSDLERAATRAACTVFLSLVFRPSSGGSSTSGTASATTTAQAAAAGASGSASAELEAIWRRSERYVDLASQSVSLVASYALRQLRELISAAPPPSAAYNEHIVGEWMAWRSSRRVGEQEEDTSGTLASQRDCGLGSDGGRRRGVMSGGLGCVLTFGYSPHVTRLLETAAATEHFTAQAPIAVYTVTRELAKRSCGRDGELVPPASHECTRRHSSLNCPTLPLPSPPGPNRYWWPRGSSMERATARRRSSPVWHPS